MIAELRQIADDQVEEQVSAAPLDSMTGLYIDDVLAVVERGVRNLPSYFDLYRKAVKQAWSPDDLCFSRDHEEWEGLSLETKKRRMWRLSSPANWPMRSATQFYLTATGGRSWARTPRTWTTS